VVSVPAPETPNRRIGTEGSETRARLVAAAERLLVAEGYAAVTSRKVAAEAGLKPQLVHYYFRTMDDLFVAVLRRRADQNLERLEQAVAAGGSLKDLWELNADPRGVAFSIELVALANHRTQLRAEIAGYAERARAAQVDAMRRALDRAGIGEDELPAAVGLLMMSGLGQVLAIEGALGVTADHRAAHAFVARALSQLECRGGT
jgi:TetR/AcrR family transcriptional regulator